jgi:hypothetical protein
MVMTSSYRCTKLGHTQRVKAVKHKGYTLKSGIDGDTIPSVNLC